MDEESAFVALGVALGVGLLIGFEREQSSGSDGRTGDTSMGGIRTYPAVALAGALATMLSREVGSWIAVAAFSAVAALVAISYADDVRHGRDRGLTSEAAMLVVFLLGALAPTQGLLATTQEKQVVVLFSVAVVVTLLLSLKPSLHAIARKATKDDVYATLKFLLVAVVLLPLLPDRAYGPLDVLNPYRIGLLIVLIAGVGFTGYVAVRALGPGKGLGITGLVGGLVSSTAVTLASAGHARREPALSASCAMAVVLANTVMGPRVLVIVAAVNPDFARVLAVPIAAVTLVGCVASWVFWRRAQGASAAAAALEIRNPFELTSAIKMGALLAAVLFVSKAAAVNLGTGAVYVTSVFAGATDVDAIAVSMAHLTGAQVAAPVAGTAVLVAIAANTVTKAGIATVVGGWPFGRTLLTTSVAIVVAALAGIALVWR
jgi:uncharacterized membrane protein (DUF4010 family)